MKENYVIAPQTDIELFKLNLQIDNKNQLTFDSINAQNNYFESLDSFNMENTTFQRNDYTIRIPLPFEEAVEYTYCRYKNNDKFYYAFITNLTYSSNEVCIATLVTDVWQTYQFDIELGVSFIEREHTKNDSFGANLVEEELELGDYIINKTEFIDKLSIKDYFICLESTINPNTQEEFGGSEIGGIPTAVTQYYYTCDIDGSIALRNGIQNILNKSEGNASAINNVFLVHPYSVNIDKSTFTQGTFVNGVNSTPKVIAFDIEKISEFGGSNFITKYTPINKKLYQYPYTYYLVTNGASDSVVYYPQYCNYYGDSSKYGKLSGVIAGLPNAGGSVRLMANYKGKGDYIGGESEADFVNYTEGINLGKLPLLSWGGDTYIAWLVNNGLPQSIQKEKAINKVTNDLMRDSLNAGGSLASGNLGGGVAQAGVGAVNAVENMQNLQLLEESQLHERKIAELQPPTISGNTNSADVTASLGLINFAVKTMCITPEYAKRIDGYFYKYGYKVNMTKKIEINTRNKFNYIKTVGANIRGNVPQLYLESIKSMFNNGVTFWHNPSTFLIYNENFNDNDIKTI